MRLYSAKLELGKFQMNQLKDEAILEVNQDRKKHKDKISIPYIVITGYEQSLVTTGYEQSHTGFYFVRLLPREQELLVEINSKPSKHFSNREIFRWNFNQEEKRFIKYVIEVGMLPDFDVDSITDDEVKTFQVIFSNYEITVTTEINYQLHSCESKRPINYNEEHNIYY